MLRHELKIDGEALKRRSRTILVLAGATLLLFSPPSSARPVETCITMGAGTEQWCTTHLSAMSYSIRITHIPSSRTIGFTLYGLHTEAKEVFASIEAMLSELEPAKSAEERARAMERLTDQANTQAFGEEKLGESTLLLRFDGKGIAFKVTRR